MIFSLKFIQLPEQCKGKYRYIPVLRPYRKKYRTDDQFYKKHEHRLSECAVTCISQLNYDLQTE